MDSVHVQSQEDNAHNCSQNVPINLNVATITNIVTKLCESSTTSSCLILSPIYPTSPSSTILCVYSPNSSTATRTNSNSKSKSRICFDPPTYPLVKISTTSSMIWWSIWPISVAIIANTCTFGNWSPSANWKSRNKPRKTNVGLQSMRTPLASYIQSIAPRRSTNSHCRLLGTVSTRAREDTRKITRHRLHWRRISSWKCTEFYKCNLLPISCTPTKANSM